MILYKDTEKLFYKKYPYKVVIDLWKRFQFYNSMFTEKNKYVSQKNEWIDELSNICPESNWKIRDNDYTVSFFFVNENDYINFINTASDITEIYKPRSDAALKAIQEDFTIILRDKLYLDKYRWRISLNSQSEESEFINWRETYFPAKDNNTERFYYFWNASREFYVNDENDLLLMKIGIGNYIKNIKKAKLYSELV